MCVCEHVFVCVCVCVCVWVCVCTHTCVSGYICKCVCVRVCRSHIEHGLVTIQDPCLQVCTCKRSKVNCSCALLFFQGAGRWPLDKPKGGVPLFNEGRGSGSERFLVVFLVIPAFGSVAFRSVCCCCKLV